MRFNFVCVITNVLKFSVESSSEFGTAWVWEKAAMEQTKGKLEGAGERERERERKRQVKKTVSTLAFIFINSCFFCSSTSLYSE